ncbi:hypothetical protein FWF89_01170 [Candidatus Saccharibacteria bacterium]|nr:hypothetical protein [Candidatus Saccharibacteria bacterium]
MGTHRSRRRLLIDLGVALGLVLLIVAARVLPHLPNFTPVAAVALFSAYFFRHRQWAASIPLIGMIIADFFLPSYAWHQRLIVYGSFLICFFIGFYLRKKYSVGRTIGTSLAASLVFYLITNCVFLYRGNGPVMYPHTLAGQITSYINALPFLKWTILGDLTYSLTLFIAYQYANTYITNKRKAALHDRIK